MRSQSIIPVAHRKQGVSPDFLRGGTLHDISGRADFLLRHDVGLTTSVQYERWIFPLLTPDTRSNVSASVQVTWWPKMDGAPLSGPGCRGAPDLVHHRRRQQLLFCK